MTLPSSPETATNPHIGIEYKYLDIENCILQLDPKALEATLDKLGFNEGVIRKIVIVGNGPKESTASGGTLASGNPLERSITIYQDEVVKGLISRNQSMQRRIGTYPESTTQNKIIDDFITPFLKKLIPSNWVYGLMGRSDKFTFYPDKKRRDQYIEKMRNPGLIEDADNIENTERAKHFLSGEIRRTTDRYLAWVMAHETEHFRNAGMKNLRAVGLATASTTIGLLLIQTADRLVPLQQTNIEAAGFLGVFAAIVFSLAVGKGMTERASYDASDKYFREFFDTIKINPEVYEKLVINPVESSKTSQQ